VVSISFFSFIFAKDICMKTGSLFLSEHLAQVSVLVQSTRECEILKIPKSETNLWFYQLNLIFLPCLYTFWSYLLVIKNLGECGVICYL
jgi:hypothetical protein